MIRCGRWSRTGKPTPKAFAFRPWLRTPCGKAPRNRTRALPHITHMVHAGDLLLVPKRVREAVNMVRAMERRSSLWALAWRSKGSRSGPRAGRSLCDSAMRRHSDGQHGLPGLPLHLGACGAGQAYGGAGLFEVLDPPSTIVDDVGAAEVPSSAAQSPGRPGVWVAMTWHMTADSLSIVGSAILRVTRSRMHFFAKVMRIGSCGRQGLAPSLAPRWPNLGETCSP